MTGAVKKGQCLCGAVTYEFSGPVNWCAHCHCESCRRNTASAFTTYFGVPNEACAFTSEQPAIYSSSEGVHRLFCSTCGTPMAYSSIKYPNETHFYLATLHQPYDDIAPQAHAHWNEHVHWVEPADSLPRKSPTGT
jgi:hypothetical protein